MGGWTGREKNGWADGAGREIRTSAGCTSTCRCMYDLCCTACKDVMITAVRGPTEKGVMAAGPAPSCPPQTASSFPVCRNAMSDGRQETFHQASPPPTSPSSLPVRGGNVPSCGALGLPGTGARSLPGRSTQIVAPAAAGEMHPSQPFGSSRWQLLIGSCATVRPSQEGADGTSPLNADPGQGHKGP